MNGGFGKLYLTILAIFVFVGVILYFNLDTFDRVAIDNLQEINLKEVPTRDIGGMGSLSGVYVNGLTLTGVDYRIWRKSRDLIFSYLIGGEVKKITIELVSAFTLTPALGGEGEVYSPSEISKIFDIGDKIDLIISYVPYGSLLNSDRLLENFRLAGNDKYAKEFYNGIVRTGFGKRNSSFSEIYKIFNMGGQRASADEFFISNIFVQEKK